MNAIFGTGINGIYFGMNEKDIVGILGAPTKRHFNNDECLLYLEYYSMSTKFKFDEDEDFKLTNIETSNKEASIFYKKIIGCEKKEVVELLNSKGYTNFEWEDYEYFDELYCYELSLWITFEYDKVTGFEFFPFIDDNDDGFLWPALPQR